MTDKEYKELSIKEFTRAAKVYETDDAGVYRMCRKDYPDVLEELEKEEFTDLLDCGCGTAPMLTLLQKKYPEKHYTGIDLTPEMIEVAKAKKMPGVKLVVGDCENLPFEENSFDVVICCQSFHHYPNVQRFFDSVFRVLRPGGRLILRDMTAKTAAECLLLSLSMLSHLHGLINHILISTDSGSMMIKWLLSCIMRIPLRIYISASGRDMSP